MSRAASSVWVARAAGAWLLGLLMLSCGEERVLSPAEQRRILLETADCDGSGRACTWAGLAGEEGFNGDGLHRLDTKLYWAMDLLFASDGTPWLIDWNNHLVRRVRPDDTVETVLGWTDPIFPGDGAADERTPDGALGTDVQLNHPTDLAELADGTLLVSAWHNHKLRAIDPSTGRVKIVAGAGAGFAGDGQPARLGVLNKPKAVATDGAGNTYILDQQNYRVRRIDSSGMIDTIAGTGVSGFSGDGGPAMAANFGFEGGSNPDPSGGLALQGERLYVADTLNNRIRAIDLTTGLIDTIAGTGEAGFAGDEGNAIAAKLNRPRDLEIGPNGLLYVADTDNSRIRTIDLVSGIIRTVAGTGELGLDLDEGRLATETTLKRPFAIELDRDGNLYIADTINSRIVRVAR